MFDRTSSSIFNCVKYGVLFTILADCQVIKCPSLVYPHKFFKTQIGVVAKRLRSAATETAGAETAAHEGDDNTPSGPTGRRVKMDRTHIFSDRMLSVLQYYLFNAKSNQSFV